MADQAGVEEVKPVAPAPPAPAVGPIFTGRSVKLGTLTWKLRDEVTFEQLLAWQESSIDAFEAYNVILSALDSIQGARGDFENLVDRTRKTIRAKYLAEGELERLAQIFEALYEPAGIREAFNTTEKFSQLARSTIEHFPRGRK